LNAPRIAIPIPHSDRDYAFRALPQYEEAVRLAGGEPVRIELGKEPSQIAQQLASCDAVLLPGSRADVQPAKYGVAVHPKTASADLPREAVDDMLLRHAYENRKPILGICYGLQSLNVHCKGSLVQHLDSEINHAAGRKVALAHDVDVDPTSLLGEIVAQTTRSNGKQALRIAVNSSHHQSADEVGAGLRMVAKSPVDGVIEALEGTAPDHFVLAVQWHPERSVNDAPELSAPARAIFEAFINAAKTKP
jgi:putative glutamine amidotransferase